MGQRWHEVWAMVSGIIEHLLESPVFYPGEEFAEEAYREFLLDDATTVYVAEECSICLGGAWHSKPGSQKTLEQALPNLRVFDGKR